MRAFITGGVRPPSDASSDVATLENGCTPGSTESTSSAGLGEVGGGGGQGMGFRDQGSVALMGATTGGAPGTRSQDLGAGLYYQPAAAGQPYLSVAQGMPGMAQALQGLPHGMQGLPHYGSLGLIGAGGPPIGGGAIGGGSMGSGPIGGGPIGGGMGGGAAGYMQFPVGSSGGGCGATAPIGRASIDWFAGAHGETPPPPPPGGARIGRSSFDEDRFRKPGAGGGAPIGSGLQPPLIGSGAGALIGGMPAPLAGAGIGHAGAQALVPGGLLTGMAMGADPLALGVGQISLPAANTSLPYPVAPISVGEAAAVDFGSALYNRPSGGGGGLDAGVLRRSSSLEAGLPGLGQGLGSGIGAALGSLEQLQGGLAPGLAVPPSVFSASAGSESGARTATGSYASSARGEPGPPLTHMGSVAEDSVFQGDDAPPFIKARGVSSAPAWARLQLSSALQLVPCSWW